MNLIDDLLDAVGSLLDGLAQKIKATLDAVIAPLAASIDSLASYLTDRIATLTSSVGALLSGLTDRISNVTAEVISGVVQATSGLLEKILSPIGEKLSEATNLLGSLASQITLAIGTGLDSIQGVLAPLETAIIEKIDQGTRSTSDLLFSIENKTQATISSGLDAISSSISPVFEKAGAAISQALEAIPGIMGELKTALLDGFREISRNLVGSISGFPGATFATDYSAVQQRVDPILKIIEESPEIDATTKQLLSPGFPGLVILGAIVLPVIVSSVVGSLASAAVFPEAQALQQMRLRQRPTTTLTIGDAITAWRRGVISREEAATELLSLGINERRQGVLFTISQAMMQVSDAVTLWRRGEIAEEELDTRLFSLGYNEHFAREIKILTQPIPPINDLILFAVKEVFSPEIRSTFGQDADFPDAILPFTQSQGLSDYWTKAYWASHWELPSVGQGFEMLQRGVLSPAELQLLLKALDVMPFWRDKLTAISYQPLTRIDIRRMHDTGILTEAEVYKAYLETGYNDLNAKRLTAFTVKVNTLNDPAGEDKIKDLTRPQILQFYVNGILAPDEAMGALLAIHYTESEANAFLAIEDIGLARKQRDLKVDLIKAKFHTGEIDFNDATTRLDGLGLASVERDLILERMEAEEQARVQLPSKADLGTMLKHDLIGADEYEAGLAKLGYREPWIKRFSALVGVQKPSGEAES